MTVESEPSAKLASILVDLLGAEFFAASAKEYVCDKASEARPLSEAEKLLVEVAALKAAELVMDEVRRFAHREEE